jgi:hypothetical protein
MSEASRAAALQHAAAVHQGSGDPVATLETADAFHAFIVGASNGAGEPAPKAAAPKATPKPKGAQVPKPAPPKEPDPEPAGEDVSKEQVGAAIAAMLNANLRNQAIALFAKYKAKSLSGMQSSDYAAILQDAQDALLNA